MKFNKLFLTFLMLFAFSVNLASAETVVYNTQTGKYHKVTCASAKKCTNNCIRIDKKEAIKRGGKPCQKCGG